MSRIALVLTEGFADWEYALIGGTATPFYGIEARYFSPPTPGKLTSHGGGLRWWWTRGGLTPSPPGFGTWWW